MLSYAGVPLNLDAPEVGAWVEQNISPEEVFEFRPRESAGMGLSGIPFSPPMPPGDVRIGRLSWPTGAQRYAVGHFLSTSADLTSIETTTYPTSSTYASAPLVLDDGNGTYSVTATMWMLPPRPLSTPISGAEGMWLLTLVDQRFFWWQQAASISAGVSWAALYAAIGTALGITISVDTIPAAYLTPPSHLLSSYHALPVMLDGVAACVGQRIVCGYSGTVTARNVTSARTSWLASAAAYPAPLAGGALNL